MENKGEKKKVERGGVTGGLGVLAPRSFPINLNKNEVEKRWRA